jgi:uncharacterized protein
MNDREVRSFQCEELRVARDTDRPRIVGYAAVFNSPTQIGDFRETIRPGAFGRALKEGQDVRALLNHNPDQIIGRSKNGTLRMREDARGLAVEIDPPDTQVGRDTVRMIEQGYLDSMSFAFRVPSRKAQRWSDDGTDRELLDLDIYDVSVVTYPAYKETTVAVRSSEAAIASRKHELRLRAMEARMRAYEEAERFNKYHGPDGKFVSGPKGGTKATGTAVPLSLKPKAAPAKSTSGGAVKKEDAPKTAQKQEAKPPERGKQASGRDMAGKSDKEIGDHHKSLGSEFKKSLTESEQFAVRTYTGEAFTPLNNELRNPKTAKAAIKKPLFKDMDNALNKSSLKEDTVVYRGIKDPSKLGLSPNMAIGATVKDPGYMSATLNPKVAAKYAGDGAVLKIAAPKGAKGASVGGISRYPKEHEMLFARGSGFKVTGVSKEGGKTVYHAELIQGAA